MIQCGMKYVSDYMWEDMESGDVWTEDGHLVGGPSYDQRQAEKDYYASHERDYYEGLRRSLELEPAKPGEERR
jgi:hypothetical protein